MDKMFEISVTRHFSSAHCLDGYPGDCARIHGHNWVVDVFVACEKLDATGLGIDFRQVKEALDQILQELDHRNLNDLPAFQGRNPTSESVARYIYGRLSENLNRDGVQVAKVRISETPDCSAAYWEA